QLSFRVSLPDHELSKGTQRAAYCERLLQRVRSIPGVRSAALTNNLPVDGYRQVGMYFRLPASEAVGLAEPPSAAVDMISSGYFQAVGIRIVSGREFDPRDREDAPPVAVISSALARRYFQGEDPVGRTIIVGESGPAREIVGIAADVRYLTKRPED